MKKNKFLVDNYSPGDNYVTCDRTGLKTKRSECRREWTGLLVRKEYWEPRQPQDFVRGKVDSQAVSDSNSAWNTDTFLTTNQVTGDSL